MADKKTNKPEFEHDWDPLPPPGPLPLDDLPPGSDWGSRLADLPLIEDYGIPGIDLDQRGWLKVPVFTARKPKADRFLLEQANSEFFLGLNMDVPTPIAWLWPERVTIGKLTLIEGESNSGTSFLVTDMAARVAGKRRWPGAAFSPAAGSPPPGLGIRSVGNCPASGVSGEKGASGEQGGPPQPVFLPAPWQVLFVNGGDHTGDTLTPRLIKAGANLADVTVLSKVTSRDTAEMRRGKADTSRRITLPADLGHIEYELRKLPDTRLVVVDSLSDFCQTDKQFRDTLRGLHEMAERCNVAVVATARPKNDRRARGKLTPSADRRSESARCVLNVLVDPHDRTQRYLAPARMNFCREPRWLPFRIGDGKVEWGQELDAAPVYERNSPADQEKATLLQEAMECLKETLRYGDLSAKVAIREVMSCGFSKATVLRARRKLGVRSVRRGFGPRGVWMWTLKKAEEVAVGENGNGSGHENGTGGNGAGENGAGHEHGTQQDERMSSLTKEFDGVDFDHLPRELVLEALNELQALERAAMGGNLPKRKAGKNGKTSKNGKRKPR